MTVYEVVISEALERESDPTKPTPIARQVVWRGLAARDEASAKAWELWDETYGPDAQPTQALRNVTAFLPQ